MILSSLIIWLTIFAIIKDCALEFDLDIYMNCDVNDLRIRKCENSSLFGFYSWNVSLPARRPHPEETMPLAVNEEVLKQGLKVMLKV